MTTTHPARPEQPLHLTLCPRSDGSYTLTGQRDQLITVRHDTARDGLTTVRAWCRVWEWSAQLTVLDEGGEAVHSVEIVAGR